MAEETAPNEQTIPDEDDEFEKWLAEDDDEEQEAVEAEYAEKDAKALKVAQETKRMVAQHYREEKVEKKVDDFLEAASDTEKELFAIFRKGDEDEKQLDRLIELVKTKANVAEGKLSGEEGEEPEETEVSAGPLRAGVRVKPDKDKELMDRIERGDISALVESIVGEDLPF